MSSTARKPSEFDQRPRHAQTHDEDPADPRLKVVRTDAASATSPLGEVFERVFQTMKTLAPEGDLLIGYCSPLTQALQVEWASGSFSPLLWQSLDVSQGPFAKIIAQENPTLLVTGPELASVVSLASVAAVSPVATNEPALAKLGAGEMAIFRVDLAGDHLALIAFWVPAASGSLSREKVIALGSIAELAGSAACASDLTLDVQAQQLHLDTLRAEIEEVQQFYRQFSDAIRQCFWVLDVESGQALVVSDNFERVWGASRKILTEGLTGFMSNVLPTDRDRVLSEFHHHLGEDLDTEFRIIDHDGEVHWIWLRAFPTRDHLSGPGDREHSRRVVLIADDITDKKNEEESIRQREADLVARARMSAVGDLATGVAHEINNPLTIIVGKAAEVKRLIEKGESNPAAISSLADKIQRTSIRIADIVSSLKSLSRHDKNMILQPTALCEIIHDIRDLVSERFKSHGVQLHVTEPPKTLTAEINGTMVSQMLLNLLNNAFDAVQKENDKWLKLEFAEDNDSVYLYVTDSGPGIPIKIRSRIFDPFFTTKEPRKGTGLGLSLAAGIAAHHNGLLRLDHLHPHTRFVAQLPKKQRPPAPSA